MYNNVLKFKGTWRKYQARVLQNANKYLDDGKIHIVAAPGSGKTTLGVELIRGLAKPAIILAPSITIREQWKSRIEEAFLVEGQDIDQMVSQNLRQPAPITIATYQALHSAMTRTKEKAENLPEEMGGNLGEERDENSTEEMAEGSAIKKGEVSESEVKLEDFSGFDLVKTMRENNVGVICLDECHHLRSEWWKALEDFRKEMGHVVIISLTATPPYDSTPAGWKKYMDMCGEIDEEITIPELVKEGSLCPHQDFVYFNYPTKAENKVIDEFQEKGQLAMMELMEDKQLFDAVRGNSIILEQKNIDEVLETPSYLSSMLIYLNAKQAPIPKSYMKLLGVKKLPDMETKWMEYLLQNILYDNPEDFFCQEAYRESLEAYLKSLGLVEKRKVTLTMSTAVEKLLINSKGKINSIIEIAKSEYSSMGPGLRMLVLTDYIRKETEKLIGSNDVKMAETMGVLPFFENLRINVSGARIGILCGGIIIIPAEAREALVECVAASNPENARKLQFQSVGRLEENDYIKVSCQGNGHFLTGAVTEIFARGYIHIMVGTKSLLGEGWDSPCINSLILASFVGSYMLSNQMRGRAIRVMKNQPDKTSNIWHLVCVKPLRMVQKEQEEVKRDVSLSEDWDMLERRMQHFMGLDYDEDIIENGTGRMTCIRMPFTMGNIKQTNKDMLEKSKERDTLGARWNSALAVSDNIEIVDEVSMDERLITAVLFFNALRMLGLSLLFVVIFWGLVIIAKGSMGPAIAFFLLMVALGFTGVNLTKVFMFKSPFRRLRKIGEAMVKAMKEQGLLTEPAYKVETENFDSVNHAIYLKGGTGRDKNLFANCIYEFGGPVDNQRYLLVSKGFFKDRYYVVPSVFAAKKESAELFQEAMTSCIGKTQLVYTRNGDGRKILLEARAKAYANIQERIVKGKKVKSALE